MKVTLGWLKEFVDFDLSIEELADKLDLSGTAIESITDLGAKFDKMVVGEVMSVEKHPDADRLNFCEVAIAGEKTGIVCGAPNVKAGQKVPVALPGATMPNGMEIKSTSIRGVVSNGMICSEPELGLGENASGIMVLPKDTKVGIPLAKALDLNDWVLEFEITPNRPDCMGVIGIAREVAALTGTSIHLPKVTIKEIDKNTADKVRVDIADAEMCPRYVARFIDNVKIGPSPLWLRRRLEAIGIRSINNVVDVTNYVLMETGQPLHAFDFQALKNGHVTVRKAKAGEKLETIDHIKRKLKPEDLIIADCQGPLALAGVMGGLKSEISDTTEEVLLESANFSPTNIRRTSRSLGLISDSSLRFEKGIDIEGATFAADRAMQLIAETAGGRVFAGAIDNYPKPRALHHIALRPDRVREILGTDIDTKMMTATLKSLGLGVKSNSKNSLDITIPSFRGDLEREVDIIEEIARLFGLNNIKSALLSSSDPDRGLNPQQKLVQKLRSLMSSAGLMEVVNYSFIGQFELDRLALPKDDPLLKGVPLINPLSEDQALLRTSLIPSLMKTVSYNYNRGQKDIGIFEIGHIFRQAKVKPEEFLTLGGAITGEVAPVSWNNREAVEASFYNVTGLIELLCEKLKLADCHIHPANHGLLQEGQAIEFLTGNKVAGFAGTLRPEAQANFDLRQPVYIFQIAIGQLLEQVTEELLFVDVPKFPAVVLDLAFVLDENIPWRRIRDLAIETGAPLLRKVRLFDLFKGEEIAGGKKSIAFSLTYQASDRTLTDNEVAHIQKRIIKRAHKELGAELRE